jgi:hypothetical protein
VGSVIAPPRNEAGIDVTAKGQKSDHEKRPARENLAVATTATRMLRARAVGFITPGAKLNKPITARYADAPACPTDAYSIAAAKNRIAKTRVSETGISFTVYLCLRSTHAGQNT